MALHLLCPGCRTAYDVPGDLLGKKVRCARCPREFVADIAEVVPVECAARPAGPQPGIQARPGRVPAPPRVPVAGPAPRSPARRPGLAVALVVVGTLAGLLLLCGGVAAVVLVLFLQAGAPPAKPLPAARPARPFEPAPAPAPVNVPANPAPPVNVPPRPEPPAPVNNPPPKPEPPRGPWLTIKPPDPVPIQPPALEGDKVVRRLPSPVEGLAVGGGGRFLVLHLPRERHLAVFDVNRAAVVKYLPLAEDDALVAAGMDRLLVVFPGTKVVQRWSLLTFEREASEPLAVEGKVVAVAMGSASNGPALLCLSGGVAPPPGVFLDPATLKVLTPNLDPGQGVPALAPWTARASADGRTFAGRDAGAGEPHSMYAIALRGQQVKVTSKWGLSTLTAVPGPDGRFLYGNGAVYSDTLGLLYPKEPTGYAPFVPARRGGLALQAVPARGNEPGHVDVYLPGQERPFKTLTDLEGVFGGDHMTFGFTAGKVPVDLRLHLLPEAKVLVTLPAPADRLILYRFDLDRELEGAGGDYLFVTSQPPPLVRPGQAYVYQLEVKSKKGGVKYRLETGPKGMAIDAAGKVTWAVPPDLAGDEASVILTVGDAGGQEVFHTFKVAVE